MHKRNYAINNVGQLALATAGILLSLMGWADETKPVDTETKSIPVVTRGLEELLAEPGYPSRWQLIRPVETVLYVGAQLQPIADFQFQEGSDIMRLTKLRSLSFLTLSSSRKTRLFIGVNEDGLVGLHYRAVPSTSDTSAPGPPRTPERTPATE